MMLARLDGLRRRGGEVLPTLRSTFSAASNLLHSYFPDYVDRTFRWAHRVVVHAYIVEQPAGIGALYPLLPSSLPLQAYMPDLVLVVVPVCLCARRLTSYWADCEAGGGGDLAAARRVWEAALKGAAGRYADTWAAFIDFERRRGHTREARSLYKRCYRLVAWGAGLGWAE